MFSEREKKIIKILSNKSMTIEDISATLFLTDTAPFDANISVSNTIRRIIKKCTHYSLPWTLNKLRVDGQLKIKKVLI